MTTTTMTKCPAWCREHLPVEDPGDSLVHEHTIQIEGMEVVLSQSDDGYPIMFLPQFPEGAAKFEHFGPMLAAIMRAVFLASPEAVQDALSCLMGTNRKEWTA